MIFLPSKLFTLCFAASSSSSLSSSSSSPSSLPLPPPPSPPIQPLIDDCLDNLHKDKNNHVVKSTTTSDTKATEVVVAASSSSSSPSPPPLVVFQVCMSPGCLADGALATYEKLVALAPPNVQIQRGTCHSLCGNGPVLDITTTTANDGGNVNNNVNKNSKKQQQRHRRVSAGNTQKIVELLESSSISSSQRSIKIPPELVEGYDLVVQGDDAFFSKKDYARAIELYQRAVQVSFRAALDWQQAAARSSSTSTSSTGSASSASTTTTVSSPLEWLVRARRNTAQSMLLSSDAMLGGLESALMEAQAACNLSRNTCWKSFRVVAEIYKLKGDKGGEYQTLKRMLALQDADCNNANVQGKANNGGVKLDFTTLNDRRVMQFRLQRLEKELNLNIN